MKVGLSGLLGIGLADLLRAQTQPPDLNPRAKSMILIWLGGGPATIDMWDPKPDAPSGIRGEFRTTPTSVPGVRFSEHLTRTASVLDHCTLVRSLHHNIPDHGPGAQYVMTGNKPTAALEHPSIGSAVSHLLPASTGMPMYFSLGDAANTGAGFLGASYDPFQIAGSRPPASADLDGVVLPASMTCQQLERRSRLRNTFDTSFIRVREDLDIVPTLSEFQQQAYDILTSNRIGEAFDLSTESDSAVQLYGNSEIGRSMLIARRLIEAGARVVTVGTTGWDTHVGNFAALRRLLPPIDQALAALITDLDQRGLLAENMVACGGEFGRTPVVNRNAGRDHWSRAMSFLLAGGGLHEGLVYGETDSRGQDPSLDPCSPDDLAATLLSQLGFPPQHELRTPSGRPVALFEHGTVISRIVA